MSKWMSVEFAVGFAVALALYLLDKAEKSSWGLNLLLLALIAGFLIHPALMIPWVWAPANGAMRVWRIVAVVLILLLGVSWFGIWTWPNSKPAAAPSNSPPTTDNIESHLVEWFKAFDGTIGKYPPSSNYHFCYRLTFRDNKSISVGRGIHSSDENELTLIAEIPFSERMNAWFNNLSELDRQTFTDRITIEIHKMKLRAKFHEHPLVGIELRKWLAIDSALTMERFIDAADDLHSDVILVLNILQETHDSLTASNAKPPSSTPR